MNETSESQQEILSSPLLDKISSPADLRQFSLSELEQLCSELREELIQTLSKIGGHFASSLGATELTVALHKVFNTPEDLLVWDVGHQAYIHKILTGRRKELSEIRKFGGISGFPSRKESPYDCFGVAHAGTSISAATGFMEAICQNSEDPENPKRRAVAIIGDGGITSGMAFEALNHAGQLHKKLIVILNDNEMSIAPNVGALSWAFSKTVTSKLSTTTRKHFKNLVEKKINSSILLPLLRSSRRSNSRLFINPCDAL
jgi:1-deoxy-D-xylulose-5-phosphate synthase